MAIDADDVLRAYLSLPKQERMRLLLYLDTAEEVVYHRGQPWLTPDELHTWAQGPGAASVRLRHPEKWFERPVRKVE